MSNQKKTMLIPVSFDEKGVNVIAFGVALARDLGLKIKLLHVLTMAGVPSPFGAPAGSSTTNDGLVEIRRDQAKDRLKVLSKRIRKEAGLDCRYSCKFGFVDVQILQQARHKNVALVVMGTPNSDTVLTQLLGSRSLKVINHSQVPVMLVPENTGYLPISSIVVGANYENWDQSKHQWITKFAKSLQADLTFVRVERRKTNQRKRQFGEYRKKMTSKLPTSYDLEDQHFKLIEEGSVEKGLRNYTHNNHGDLIALQRSQKSEWKHLFSGNVSKEVVEDAGVPVLVY